MKWRDHPILKPPSDEEMVQMAPDELANLHALYHEALSNADKDPYRYGFVLENWKQAEKTIMETDTLLVLGGNRCLAGEQIVSGQRVDSIEGTFEVEAYDQATGKIVKALALKPFRKPAQSLYRVELSNGQSLSCSAAHRVLTPSGWQALERLAVGSRILGPAQANLRTVQRPSYLQGREPSTSGIFQAASPQDGESLNQITANSLSRCSLCYRPDGEQPRSEADYGQDASPSQDGALGYVSPCGSSYRSPLPPELRLLSGIHGDLGRKQEHSHFGQECDLRSSWDGQVQTGGLSFDTQSHSCGTPCKLISPLSGDQSVLQDQQQSPAGFHRQQSSWQFPEPDNQSHCALAYSGNSVAEVLIVKIDYLRDDTVWDFEVPDFHNYVAGGVINHNSSKTQLGAWLTVKSCMGNPGSLIVCFAQNAELSVLVQQSAIFHHLPAEFKSKRLGQDEYISYTKQNGFAGNSLIFPNSSRILFKTYSQFQQNQTVLEGMELGSYSPQIANLGAWCDEYLGGPELINTLGFRLATRNAKMLLTFTPIEGYTETVRQYLDGAKTIESKPADLLNGRMVPTVQKCAGRDAAILYLHTKDNPFSGYERVAKEAIAKNDESWILCRLYGVPTKSISGKFPMFSREVNVIKHDKIPTKDVTRYMVLDPAGRKNWFMCWIAVDASDTYYVYREWPGVDVGDWAKWHNGKWIGGEGSKGLGYGIKDYVDLIMRHEEGETIYERLIDPRLGAAKYQAQNGSSSIIEDLADAGLTFIPAPGLEIEDGLQAIQNKMSYNKKQPTDALNRPHFYISDRCENIISGLCEYTGEGGPDEAFKDPVDCIRYACLDGIRYLGDQKQMVNKKRGGY